MTLSILLKQLFTGKDNETLDIGRISWAICIFTAIGFAVYQLIESKFSLIEFGQTISAIVGVHSAGIWAKKDAEPEPQKDTQQ